MRKKDSLTRTKTIYKEGDNEYYEYELMPYSKFVNRSKYKYVGTIFKEIPYKWYDLRRFYEIPNHRLSLLINKLLINKKLKTENNTPLKKSLIEKISSHPLGIIIISGLFAGVINSERVMRFINKWVDWI